MKDKRAPIPQHGYYASDGSFLHQLYALSVMRNLKPSERKEVIDLLNGGKR